MIHGLKNLVDLKPVFTPETDPFVRLVYDVCGVSGTRNRIPKSSLLHDRRCGTSGIITDGAPTVILGPGQPEMAHQTDEYCEITSWRGPLIFINV